MDNSIISDEGLFSIASALCALHDISKPALPTWPQPEKVAPAPVNEDLGFAYSTNEWEAWEAETIANMSPEQMSEMLRLKALKQEDSRANFSTANYLIPNEKQALAVSRVSGLPIEELTEEIFWRFRYVFNAMK